VLLLLRLLFVGFDVSISLDLGASWLDFMKYLARYVCGHVWSVLSCSSVGFVVVDLDVVRCAHSGSICMNFMIRCEVGDVSILWYEVHLQVFVMFDWM
jgi:hypothetical protein